MFKAITYKNTIGPDPLIDIGALAEGLLFYERVAIVGNSGTVRELLSRIPPFVLLSLLRDGRLEFHYLGDQVGVSTTPVSNGKSIHSLISFSSPDHTIEKVGPKAFKEAAGGTSQARIGASQFSKLLRPIDHSDFDQSSVLHALADNRSSQLSVLSLIREVVPAYSIPRETYFKIERENNGFYVDTNLDFAALNSAYHRTVPPAHSSLTEAYLLALIQGAYEATYFAAKLDAEIAVHPIERAIQAKAVEAVALRHSNSQAQIESFTDLTLPCSHAIREAVNSGRVPFSSVVKLLDSADKFRHWLHQQPPDSDLLRAYYQETIKESWVEKLPAKSTRWSIFTGIGLGLDALGAGGFGTAAATALSAGDAFILDKLIKGWKPHQFVEKDLKALFSEELSRQRK
ncbi:hypothetical protein ACFQUU_25990 [Herbaspirillum sp. GCM10030257]|uniref:hypothetical protein n=1 Tax=Herbaspirillum sp. GCM10030257 TaxID=3273393 RepID=UPI00361405A5